MHLRPVRWRSAVYEMADASPNPRLTIYEEKYWGLDPLFRSHCKFYISDVMSLPEAPDKPGMFSEYKQNLTMRTNYTLSDVKMPAQLVFMRHTLECVGTESMTTYLLAADFISHSDRQNP